MEESFELRVKRLFGSHLFDKVPSSAFSDKAWSVASGEVERHQWNRSSADEEDEPDGPSRGDTPCSSAFYDPDGCLADMKRKKKREGNPRKEKDGIEADDESGDEEGEEKEGGRDDGAGDEDERDVRSSIGLDPTLDREEEEDEFDRAALGQDKVTDRVYMNEVMDHGPDISIYSVVPEVYDNHGHGFYRDPRADRSAACKRIKEDAVSIPGRPRSSPKITEVDPNLKPILKRRDSEDDPKPKKRVRFDPKFEEETRSISQAAPQPMDASTDKDTNATVVPDYLMNPSKYTKYTFDSGDENDDEMNKKAFQHFQRLINRSNGTNNELDSSFELPGSVTFTPRKKLTVDAMSIDVGPTASEELVAVSSSCLVGMAAGVGNETCEMEEDFVEEKPAIRAKPARKYRSKVADKE
ncbi:Protein TSSC4 [Rhynchospora pubera]|uniref:U5 small nuclear ribonucleoprotein TSSC4 n=1 Tax=Rhynchospora pubera TaxID=906938 RepID=A0AAV8D377_9POAL|nr:Protein TSSC4 [Rhynchospora pubera]